MIRKIFLAGLAVVAGLFILNSTHLGSYARTAWSKIRAHAKAQVPLEYQLETVRNEVAQFMPEMKNQISALAAESYAVKKLRNEVTELQACLNKQRGNISAMKEELKTVKTSLDGRGGPVERLKNRLDRDVASYKRCADELKAKESLLEAKEASLEAERDKLNNMKAQKEQWEVQIAQMETELKLLRSAQTKSTFQLDDSKFAQIKGMLNDLKDQIQVQKTAADMWGAFSNDVPVEKQAKTTAQVIREAEEVVGDNSDIKVEASK
jgi:chromosome segregation ATPase